MRLGLFTSSALAMLALSGNAALAQEAAQEAGGIDEVVVTAQRREENLQNAAISVTALSAETITDGGVRNVSDLTQLVPALQSTTTSGPYSNLSLRGVSSVVINSFGDPAIAVNVDQVFLSRATSSRGLFYDIERVEVLKGPQGILYGRNATGGAINVITRAPELGVFGGNLDLDVGNYALVNLGGALNVPVGDQAALRFSFQTVDRDGYFSDDTEDENRDSARLALRVEPTNSLSITLRADYTSEGGRGPGATGLNHDVESLTFFSDPWDSINDQSSNPAFNGQYFACAGPCEPLPTNSFQDNEYWGFGGEANLDIGGGVLTMIASHREDAYNFLGTSGGFIIREDNEGQQSSAEVRYASNEEQLISYVLGAYILDTSQTGASVYDQQAGGISSVQDIEVSGESWATFGQLTFNLTDAFRLTGGARYTNEEKDTNSILGVTTWFQPEIDPPGFQLASFPTVGSNSWNSTDWRAGIEWDVAENSLLYANVGTGFKSGGFFFNIDGDSLGNSYDPETVTAYTVGLKNRFLDNRLQVNLEAFQLDYEDQQVAVLTANDFGVLIFPNVNAGASTIQGAEIDVQYLLTENTLVSMDMQYVDASYDDFQFRQALNNFVPLSSQTRCATSDPLPISPVYTSYNVNCSGKPLINTPEWVLNIGLEQTFPLSNGASLVASVNTRYESERETDIQGLTYLPFTRADSSTRTNLNLTYNSADDRWRLGAYVNNVEDAVDINQASVSGGGAAYQFANLKPPRTYGVRLSTNF